MFFDDKNYMRFMYATGGGRGAAWSHLQLDVWASLCASHVVCCLPDFWHVCGSTH